MPRASRKKSETGIYHVMARGTNRQDIFLDTEDMRTYLDRISKYRSECGFQIYAYCLMSNHVHLLIKESNTKISEIMKRINSSYAYWFNWKYNRTGHLFQDRFRSEPVEDDKYLLSLVRYIHQNPTTIGSDISTWTSYNDYLSKSGITDIEFVLNLFSNNTPEAIKLFVKFVNELNDDKHMDFDDEQRKTEAEAIATIKRVGKITDCKHLQNFEKEPRDIVIRILKEEGLSIRQIERLTGLNRGLILKA